MKAEPKASAAALIVLSATVALGSDYRVRAFVQPDQDVTEQQTVRLVVEAEGPGSPKLSVSGLNDLVNLQVVGGPERVFKSTWSNGRMSAKTSLGYTLLPKGPGRAEVPALTVEIDGEKARTQPIRFEVAKAVAGVPPRSSQRRSSRGRTQESADVFLRAQLSADEVWVGESVSLSVLLYSGERISTPSLASQPSLSSFWVEEIDVDAEGEASRATIQGRQYVVFPMIRKVLVPQTAGEIEIEPFVMQIPVPVRTGDPFDSLFSLGRTRTVVRKTEPLTLKVRPLPGAGRPQDFGGAVGEYKLDVSMDRLEASVNDAVGLVATIEGKGFLRAVSSPVLDMPPDIKVFDPKVTTRSRTVAGELVSSKTWEWVLVPLVTGELGIPAIRVPYFDTEVGEYRVASAEPGVLTVKQNGNGPDAAVARRDIRLQRRDLAFIKPLRGTLRQRTTWAHERGTYLALLMLPLAWAPVVILVGRHRAKLQQNLGLARSRKARSRARQRLRIARKRIDAADAASFHEEVARALVEYVADRFDRSAAGLTYQLADELLASRGFDEPLRQEFRTCLETCDFARFVPDAAATERRTELLSEAELLIDRLEKAW